MEVDEGEFEGIVLEGGLGEDMDCSLAGAGGGGAHGPVTGKFNQGIAGGGVVIDDESADSLEGIGSGCGVGGFGTGEAEGEPERGALAWSAMESDHAAHELDELFGDGESEAGAAVFSGEGTVSLAEGLEEPVAGFWGDADPCIGDFEAEADGVVRVGDGMEVEDDLAGFRKLDGVGEEVGDDLAQPSRVAEDLLGECSMDPGHEFESFGFGAFGEEFHGAFDAVDDIEGHGFDGEFTGFELGEVEDVVDEGEEGVCAAADGFAEVALFGGEGGIEQ